MMPRILVAIAGVLSFYLFSFTAVTAQAASDGLVVVTGNDFTPFSDQNMASGGLITEIVATAFARAELTNCRATVCG